MAGTPTTLKGAAGAFQLIVESAAGLATIECDLVLLACGPWTGQVAAQLGVPMRAAITGIKAHSVLLEPSGPVDDACLFMDWRGEITP